MVETKTVPGHVWTPGIVPLLLWNASSLASDKLLTFMCWLVVIWRFKRDPLLTSQAFSACSTFLSSILWTLAPLAPSNPASPTQLLASTGVLLPHSRNSFQGKKIIGFTLLFFFFLRDHYLALSDVQCLKISVSHISSGVCFNWEDESSLSYSILGRSHMLLFLMIREICIYS